jgi:ectoine hydroxylase-related dioxygenase (phytanoyl-CoA dioxygenase family)
MRAALSRVIAVELTRESDDGLPPEFRYGHDRKGAGSREPGAGSQTTEGVARRVRAIHQYVNIWKVCSEYRETIHNPSVTAAIRDLMGVERVRLWHDQVISKPPGDNEKFGFHHDFYFWPMDRPRLITCWLALDDATVENGCMHVIPGSHRDPRFQPAECDLSADIHLAPAPRGPGEPGSFYQEVRGWDVDQATPVELKAGECMFHHCLNYHMTPKNVTDRQRRAFIMIFMPDGTRYKHSQSPNHVCTNYLGLPDGWVYSGEGFPVCGGSG